MPALGAPASDIVYLSAGQIYSDISHPTPTPSSTSYSSTLSGHESHTRQTVPSPTVRSRSPILAGNPLAPGVATSSHTDVGDSKECARRMGGVGRGKTNTSLVLMKETKRGDRPNIDGQNRFSATTASEPAVALVRDDCEKQLSSNGALVKKRTPLDKLPSPSLSMPTPSALPPTVPSSIPSNLLFVTRSPDSTSTAASSTQSPAILAVASPSPTAKSFSAATVIALTTVLSTTILILLVIIIYLLRARRKPLCRSQSKENSAHGLPMVDIQRDLENPQSQPPFITLSHSVSPFSMSLHELSKSAVPGGDGRAARSASVMTHLSSDSGLAHHSDLHLPTLPSAAHMQPALASTPALTMRHLSIPEAGEPRSDQRPSISVERASEDSGTASTVVFAREKTEDGSPGPISRDELGRGGSPDAHTSSTELPSRPSEAATESPEPPSAPSLDQPGTSETPTAEEYDARSSGGPTPKGGLRLLGIGPSSPYGLHLLSRAHLAPRSRSSPTYGLPSMQISPRLRPSRTREPSSETNPQGDFVGLSFGRVQDLDNSAETQRIHPQSSSSISPSTSPETPSGAPSARPSRERQSLSITVPPRLGAPIVPVAELIAAQSPSSQQTPRTHARHNTPRSRSTSRIPAFAGSEQLSVLDSTNRPRGMSDSEPSPETRERVLRLLGRLPENSQGGSESQRGEPRVDFRRSEQPPRANRAQEVRRSQSESVLPPIQQPDV